MFQADGEFYQYTAEGDEGAPTWQPAATQHIIQEGEVLLRAQERSQEHEDAVGDHDKTTQKEEEGGQEEAPGGLEVEAEGEHEATEVKTEAEPVRERKASG